MSPENLEKLALAAMKINIMAVQKDLNINIPIVHSSISTNPGYQKAYLALLDTVEALIQERVENLKLREEIAGLHSSNAIERWMIDRDRQGGA